MIETRKLQSGARVIVKRMEGLLSVTMGILVGTGSAFERDEEDGISHFVEHMQFKGTPTRDAFAISDAFDALGAQVNAFTGKDMTCYYAKATTDHAAEAFGLLADLFLNADFPEKELERERKVILEEIGMDEDSPEDLCLDLLARASFGRENYGRNILGPASNVKRFTREDILRYKRARYGEENIVISFAGNIEIAEAMELAETYFGTRSQYGYEKREKAFSFHNGAEFRYKAIEQVHFALAVPTVCRDDVRLPAVQVMNTILGGGLSSRIYKRVREELGLAYSVYSYTTHYEEGGVLAVYAAVNPAKAEEALKSIFEVIETFRKEGVSEAEFERGREQLKSGNIFSQESTSSQMLLYGRNLLYRGEIYDFGKKMEEISSLKLADVEEAMAFSLDFSHAAVSTVGRRRKPLQL